MRWERNEEGRSPTFDRFEPDASTVLLDERPADIQSQAGPTDFLRVVGPLESNYFYSDSLMRSV